MAVRAVSQRRNLRALISAAVVAVLASFALIAGPLSTQSRAADVFDLGDFYDEIDAANAATEPYTITLQDDIVFFEADASAALTASADVTIDGNGYDVTCANGEECAGWLTVDNPDTDASVEITDIAVSGFERALYVYDTSIVIEDSTFEGNGFTSEVDAEFGGAALYVDNTASFQTTTLTNVDFLDNEIVALEGCVYGGAASIGGNLTMTGGSFENNGVALTTAEEDDVCYVGAGALELYASGFTITGTSFEFNTAEGVYDEEDPFGNVVGGAVTVYESEGVFSEAHFQDNDSEGLGGAVHVQESFVAFEDSDVTSNTALYGGGIHALDSYIELDGSVIAENSADFSGGGMYMSYAPLRAHWTEFKDNVAEDGDGGAIEFYGWGPFVEPEEPVGDSEILWSLFHGNSAQRGGAFDVYEAEVFLGASTLTDNASDVGAAILVEEGSAELEHVTIARNTITSDNSAQVVADSGAEIDLRFSAVVEALGAGDNCDVGDASYIDTNGFNASDDQSCDFDGFEDIEMDGGDFELGPLQFNGGPTWTMLPSPESPLVDAIDSELCLEVESPTEGMDQRSVELEQWDGCDIGAVEIFEPVQGVFPLDSGTVVIRVLNIEGAEGGPVDLSEFTPAAPAGVAFPYGGFEIGMLVWGEGWPADIEYFTPAPTNQLWKLFEGEWVQPPGATSVNDEGGTLWSFRVFDGGFGDNDGETNAVILDPFAAGVGAAFTG